jgi:hypothetical protein
MLPILSKLVTTSKASLRILSMTYLISEANPSVVVLMGPEKNISVLGDQVKGITWDGTGIGYGVRGSRRVDLTLRLQGKHDSRPPKYMQITRDTGLTERWLVDIIQLYRAQAPSAPILFDYSPDSALWAIQQQFPLSSNCTESPGKNLVGLRACNPRTF